MSDPASERPSAPDLAAAPLFNNWFIYDDRDPDRMVFFGLRDVLSDDAPFAATWLELATLDEDGGWARDVHGRLIRLGTKMPKAEPDPDFEKRFGEDFWRRYQEARAEADRQDGR